MPMLFLTADAVAGVLRVNPDTPAFRARMARSLYAFDAPYKLVAAYTNQDVLAVLGRAGASRTSFRTSPVAAPLAYWRRVTGLLQAHGLAIPASQPDQAAIQSYRQIATLLAALNASPSQLWIYYTEGSPAHAAII